MNRRFLLALISGACLCSGGTIGNTAASPMYMPANTATAVTVTSQILDPTLIPTTVILQRVDQTGKILAILGTLRDDGVAPDAVAGDGTFTIRLNMTITSATLIRVSAGFEGELYRTVSPPITLTPGTAPTGAIKEVSFSDDLTIRKDLAGSAPVIMDPVWKRSNAPTQNDRVGYAGGATAKTTIKFELNPVPGAPIPNVTVEGLIPGLGRLVKNGVTLPAAAEATVTDMVADAAFPARTRFYNPMMITWRYTADGGTTYVPLGTTSHILYVTLANPLQLQGGFEVSGVPVYLTTLHLAVSVDGAATQLNALTNTWGQIAGPANIKTWDGRLLYYYRDGIGFTGCALDEGELLTFPNGSGQCGSFARLLQGALGLNGIDSTFTRVRAQSTGAPASRDQMLVRNWTFNAPSFPAAPLYRWSMTFNPVAIAAGDVMVPKQPGGIYGDLANQVTLRGQNTAPPSEKVFGSHFFVEPAIVGLARPYYDASYGVTYADIADVENAALDGYLRKFALDADNVYRVKRSTGLNELEFY